MCRGCLTTIFAVALAFTAAAAPEAVVVNLDYVAKLALARAQHAFHAPDINLPGVLNATNLDYDKYREIRFIPGKALWTEDDLPFRVEFVHPGYIYNEPVRINEFTAGYTQPVPFVQDFFDYGNLKIKNEIPRNVGYGGFKIVYQLNTTNVFDDLAVFAGASYFRVLGKGQSYGMSARGLALDPGETDRNEEFPVFTDWWLGKPQKNATNLILYGILDTKSCAGAYEFNIQPGETTIVDVDAVLYFRQPNLILQNGINTPPIKTVGMAALTSSYWFGKTTEYKPDDYRSAVHDSDGFMMEMANGERLWEPLDNPRDLRHQVFAAPHFRGFGLMQRERNFTAYQDLFTDHQDEPSVWVEPRGTNWTDGGLHLIELNGPTEDADNMVAFWSPKTVPAPLQPWRFSYTLFWTRETDRKFSPADKVVATRVGLSKGSDDREIMIDFTGPDLLKIAPTNPPVAIVNCTPNATIVADQVVWNPFEKRWRAVLKMQPPTNNTPVNLRCTLQQNKKPISETWIYQWTRP
ncbi:MAG TPA: glucan biosynthesis protein G [Alphaproteobacteria bacterium]|nr:glucan biosynthesis protein G [Alphaproteobacteria bacterium]